MYYIRKKVIMFRKFHYGYYPKDCGCDKTISEGYLLNEAARLSQIVLTKMKVGDTGIEPVTR